MNLLASIVPFSLQTLLYRGLTGSLKYVGKALSLVIHAPEILVGPGTSLTLCDAIVGTGARRLLLVTDGTLVKLGVVGPLQQRLESQGLTVTLYDGVLPDPAVEQIEQGLALLQRDFCQAVLAVGGGSVMDAAKIIAARATNAKPVEKMTGLFKLSKAPLPVYCVPTTAGTGSEVTIAAVVSDPAQKRKLPIIDPRLLPKIAALDGRLMTGLPPAATAATGMDALTHAVEAYLSRIATSESDKMALEAVALIMRHLPRVVADGQDEESRQMMSWAAYRAGLAFTWAGLGYVHGIAHNLGAHYHTPHGLANAIVLPYVLDHAKPECLDRLADLAHTSGLSVENGGTAALANEFIAHIRAMNRQFEIPERLPALRKVDIPAIASAALQEAHFTYAVPRYMDQAGCEALLRKMLL